MPEVLSVGVEGNGQNFSIKKKKMDMACTFLSPSNEKQSDWLVNWWLCLCCENYCNCVQGTYI